MTFTEWIFITVFVGFVVFALLEIASALNNIAGAIRGHYNMMLQISASITKGLAERKTKP